MRQLKIGIDNGGVCSMHRPDGDGDGEELDMPGVRAGLEALRAQGHTLCLESFAGRKRALGTHAALAPTGLFDAFHFSKRKEFKAALCEHFGLDVMVDDTFEVAVAVAEQNPSMLVLYFAPPDEVRNKMRSNMRRVGSWPELVHEVSVFALEPVDPDAAPQEVGCLDDARLNKMMYKLEL